MSGIPADVIWAAIFRLRDGQINRVDVHGDWEKALKAVAQEE
jgi:hypothetical protein